MTAHDLHKYCLESGLIKSLTQKINIIVNFDISCRGLQGKDLAEKLVSKFFKKENLSFDGWHVAEIPLTGEHVCICIENLETKQAIALYFKEDDSLTNIAVGQCDEAYCESIRDAIKHPKSYYKDR